MTSSITLNPTRTLIVITATLKHGPTYTLIKLHVPGSRLLVSSLPGSTLRTHVESPGHLISVLKALPGKLGKPRDLT